MKKTGKTLALIIALLITATLQAAAQDANEVSPRTVASVVRLGKLMDLYVVKGMPANFQPTVEYGIPNFGGGKTVQPPKRYFWDLGSGVIVTKNGWLFTNAHVADDWTANSVIVQPFKDNTGATYDQVLIPAEPGYMWVTVATEDDVKNFRRRVTLKYLCQTMYYDSDYNNYDRDRAICKIIAHAQMNPSTELPEVTAEWTATDTVPVSSLGNPFYLPELTPKVWAIGFPGSGSQTFHSITEGNFANYDSDERSYILHHAFISGGNSGGGLYYKNNLIGINTWDRSDPHGRHLSIAQPVTYYAEAAAYVYLWYNVKDLPDIPKEWIDADPSNDPYKNEVYIGFNVRSQANQNVAVKSGYLIAYKADISVDTAFNYINFKDYMQYYYLVRYLANQGYTAEVIAPYLQMDLKEVRAMINMNEQELLNSLDQASRGFLDVMKSGKFYASYWNIDQFGQVLAAVSPQTKLKVYVTSNGYKDQVFDYNSTAALIQGPFDLKMPMQ
ncbi:MAG: trypsin-like peptidase domain-containing protein [Spirochaetales bacterium]|nr:trypsin-like peptidase domain-containing protein [Spirochaetales bacterium]